MIVAYQDSVLVPPGAASDLGAFRDWTKSENFPDRGDVCFLGGQLWVDMTMETVLHNQLKGLFAVIVGGLVLSDRLGRFFGDRMRLVNEEAGLSTEPDGMFVSGEALRCGRVLLAEGADSLEVVGTPDMVLEVVSGSSVEKDTELLRELYAAAGIAEYWLVNPLVQPLSFDIFRLAPAGYAPTRRSAGWLKSGVFGKSFHLLQEPGADDLPSFRLEVR
jgi:Uma2 family endonuclease